MADARRLQAAYNNAAWCALVCSTHGAHGTFLEQLWLTTHPAPRYYPNAVTLRPTLDEADWQHIRQLATSGLPGEWGIKDSFATLDLAPLGFRLGFEAEWFYGPAARPVSAPLPAARWVRVTTSATLLAWEVAWQGYLDLEKPRHFLPSLLEDQNTAILAGYRGEQLVAGVIAYRTGEVVGISNLSLPPDETAAWRGAAVAAAASTFPDLALVGYERGEELSAMLALGFESVGPLKVWFKQAQVTAAARDSRPNVI